MALLTTERLVWHCGSHCEAGIGSWRTNPRQNVLFSVTRGTLTFPTARCARKRGAGGGAQPPPWLKAMYLPPCGSATWESEWMAGCFRPLLAPPEGGWEQQQNKPAALGLKKDRDSAPGPRRAGCIAPGHVGDAAHLPGDACRPRLQHLAPEILRTPRGGRGREPARSDRSARMQNAARAPLACRTLSWCTRRR